MKLLSILKETMSNWIRREKRQTSGTGAKKEESGIRNMGKWLLQTLNQLKLFAKSAAKDLKAKEHLQNFAQINVEKDGEENIGELNIKAHVLCAGMNLKEQNIKHPHQKEKHAQNFVQTDSIIKTEKKKVYNLTVDKDHVYYAHGLLVSNCDALTGICEVINDLIEFDTGPSIEEQERALRNLGF